MVDFYRIPKIKSTKLGPCENRLYWDPAPRHSPEPGPTLGPGWEAPGRPWAAPPSRVPGLARAQGCASEPGPNIIYFRMVPI